MAGCHDSARLIFKTVADPKSSEHLRAPYERVFSHRPKRVRYRGLAKNQFAAFLQAMVFNLKRLVVLDANFVVA